MALIGSGYGEAHNTNYDSVRVPISFTSTYRLGAEKIRNTALKEARNKKTSLSVDEIKKEWNYDNASKNIFKNVEMLINPHTIQFTQPKRFTKMDHRNGSVFFHFANEKGQNNDILKLTFNGNTGNIDRRSYAGADKKKKKERDYSNWNKLLAWHNLYQLTREPVVLKDGTRNEFIITYMSPLFPVPIDFYGFYNNVLTFSEAGITPFSREYTFEFTVSHTEPDLDSILDAVQVSTEEVAAHPKSTGSVFPSLDATGPGVIVIGVTE
jgi:hypothetical protein